jgi:hypothetical protein
MTGHSGSARGFATADGESVTVAALTKQEFIDLVMTARRVPFLWRAARGGPG